MQYFLFYERAATCHLRPTRRYPRAINGFCRTVINLDLPGRYQSGDANIINGDTRTQCNTELSISCHVIILHVKISTYQELNWYLDRDKGTRPIGWLLDGNMTINQITIDLQFARDTRWSTTRKIVYTSLIRLLLHHLSSLSTKSCQLYE